MKKFDIYPLGFATEKIPADFAEHRILARPVSPALAHYLVIDSPDDLGYVDVVQVFAGNASILKHAHPVREFRAGNPERPKFLDHRPSLEFAIVFRNRRDDGQAVRVIATILVSLPGGTP